MKKKSEDFISTISCSVSGVKVSIKDTDLKAALDKYIDAGNYSYIFDNKDQIIFVKYIADVKIADCDMQIRYFVSGEDFKRSYSYIQEYNLDRKLDADDLRTFCQYTKVPQNVLTNKLKDFMDHLENQTNPSEKISLDSGTLILHYLGMGEINITYETMEEKLR